MKFNIGFLGGTKPATVSWTAVATDGADTGTYTFADVAIGTADATRAVIVGVWYANSNLETADPDSVTVGGISATKIVTIGANIRTSTMWIASVPTGATASIVVARGGAGGIQCMIEVWAAYDLLSSTPTDTLAVQTGNPNTGTIDVSAGGIIICSAAISNTATYTFDGVTFDDDTSLSGATVAGASIALAAADTGRTITADPTTATIGAMVVAALR